MKTFTLKKKTRRQLKKTSKALRKALKHAGGPIGITTGALTLGGIAAFAALDPDVRSRARELASSARDLLRQITSGERESQPSLLHAH